MDTPETLMKFGFQSFFDAKECFKQAIVAYKERGNEEKGDSCNATNVTNAITNMNLAYDDMSEIWENDIQSNINEQ